MDVFRNRCVAVRDVLRNRCVAVRDVLRNRCVAVRDVLRNRCVAVRDVLRNRYAALKVLCKSFMCRFFFGALFGVFLIMCIISLVIYWGVAQVSSDLPLSLYSLPVNNSFDCSSGFKKNAREEDSWEIEYGSRAVHLWDTCLIRELYRSRGDFRARSNCWNGTKSKCQSKLCPVIVDEQQILFCVIPYVASSHIWSFFLNKSNIHINATLKNNSTALQAVADDALLRINPRYYYTSGKFKNYLKIIFVCHPFDRLVSAFRNKAERSRDEVPYYYYKYWDPLKKRIGQRRRNSDRITFKEFVRYLLITDQGAYDDHWASFWGRCKPCIIDYDFIGKLETAKNDFLHAFCKAGIEFSSEWWDDIQPYNHTITLQYFATVPKSMIRSLYSIYKLDFDLFGYSVDEFLSQNVTVI